MVRFAKTLSFLNSLKPQFSLDPSKSLSLASQWLPERSAASVQQRRLSHADSSTSLSRAEPSDRPRRRSSTTISYRGVRSNQSSLIQSRRFREKVASDSQSDRDLLAQQWVSSSSSGGFGGYLFGMSEKIAKTSSNTNDFKNPSLMWIIGFLFIVSFVLQFLFFLAHSRCSIKCL